jgi:hypothetical protein
MDGHSGGRLKRSDSFEPRSGHDELMGDIEIDPDKGDATVKHHMGGMGITKDVEACSWRRIATLALRTAHKNNLPNLLA